VAAADTTVETVRASDLSIKPCIGDFHCWHERPGQCIHRDDMDNLLPKLREADIWVLGIPVYIPMPGAMQDLLNRLCPLVEPVLNMHYGRTRARLHEDVKLEKVVLVSASGWWELGNFGTVTHIVNELASNMGVEFAGAVLRPHAYAMDRDPEVKGSILASVREAGRQLVVEGRMNPETLDEVSRPLMTFEECIDEQTREYLEAKDRMGKHP
jgi:multimeric flavodoxin WrbA